MPEYDPHRHVHGHVGRVRAHRSEGAFRARRQSAQAAVGDVDVGGVGDAVENLPDRGCPGETDGRITAGPVGDGDVAEAQPRAGRQGSPSSLLNAEHLYVTTVRASADCCVIR